jgi:hypothetical protein
MPYSAIDGKDFEKILKNLSGKQPSITITAGAANVSTFTLQFPTAEVYAFEMFMSTSAVGANVSSTTYSTGLAVTTGAISFTKTANKVLDILTDATGKAVITLTATAKPVGEFLCVSGGTGALAISAGTVTGSFG